MTRQATPVLSAGRRSTNATRARGAPPSRESPRAEVTPTYLEGSERPGTSLIFLAPLILLYELYAVGVIAAAPAGRVRADSHITAFLLIEQLFQMLGVAARHLPALALVAMLLAAHVARQDRWAFHPSTLFAMAIEALAWSIPLLVLGFLLSRLLPMAGASMGQGRWAILCLGAGVYEEMVFRLIGVTVLSLILRDVLAIPRTPSVVVILLGTGLLFSMYHYLSPGEDFRLRPFIFRTLAGVFFGMLFLLRGFGITAGSHAAYDLIVVGLLAPVDMHR